MRSVLTLSVLLLVAARAMADDAPAKPATDDTIINLCGSRLPKLFAQCGNPDQIFVNDDKKAILDYGNFGFRVEDKTITGCYFFDGWKTTFKGVKFGDTKDQTVKVLGKSFEEVKGKGFDAYGWELKDLGATFWLYFTDDKVSSVQITLKN